MKKDKHLKEAVKENVEKLFDDYVKNDPEVQELIRKKRDEPIYGRVAEPSGKSQTSPYVNLYKKQKSKGQRYAIKGFAMAEQWTYIVGDEGHGKTTLGVYLAIQNRYGRQFWSSEDQDNVPKGRGGRTLYIQSERKAQEIIDRVYAAGGNGDELILLDDYFNDGKGGKCWFDITQKGHYEALINRIKIEKTHPDGLDLIVFDSHLEFLGDIIFKAVETKNRMRTFLKDIEGLDIGVLCIAYMKKDKTNTDSLHSIYGTGAQSQIATAVWKTRPNKSEGGYVMRLEKSNWSKNNRRGGFGYKTISGKIPDIYLEDVNISEDDKEFGIINSFQYLDKSYSELVAMSEPETKKEQKRDNQVTIIEGLLSGLDKIEGTVLRTKCVKAGIAPWYLKNNLTGTCSALGYDHKSEGRAGNQKWYYIKKPSSYL